MKHHHKEYVPSVETEASLLVESSGERVNVLTSESHKILFGGDQLTVARSRSAIRNVANGESSSAKLLGLVPVIEDWHTKLTVLTVSCTGTII